MNDQKQLLFTVTDGIADEYLAEAAAPRFVFPTHAIKRIAAIAAMIAILLTCLLWNPATETPAPALAIRVFAAENGEQTMTVDSAPIPIDGIFSTATCEHSIPEKYDLDGFFFRICKAENFPQMFFSEVAVEYDGGSLRTGQMSTISKFKDNVMHTVTVGSNIILIGPNGNEERPPERPSCVGLITTNGDEMVALFPVEKLLHPEDGHLCIHGKLKETTDMKIKLYVSQDGKRKLFQTVTVRINVTGAGYTLEVLDITINDQ